MTITRSDARLIAEAIVGNKAFRSLVASAVKEATSEGQDRYISVPEVMNMLGWKTQATVYRRKNDIGNYTRQRGKLVFSLKAVQNYQIGKQ